jgi:hypothetical protein
VTSCWSTSLSRDWTQRVMQWVWPFSRSVGTSRSKLSTSTVMSLATPIATPVQDRACATTRSQRLAFGPLVTANTSMENCPASWPLLMPSSSSDIRRVLLWLNECLSTFVPRHLRVRAPGKRLTCPKSSRRQNVSIGSAQHWAEPSHHHTAFFDDGSSNNRAAADTRARPTTTTNETHK